MLFKTKLPIKANNASEASEFKPVNLHRGIFCTIQKKSIFVELTFIELFFTKYASFSSVKSSPGKEGNE